jgi:hypothetical protein
MYNERFASFLCAIYAKRHECHFKINMVNFVLMVPQQILNNVKVVCVGTVAVPNTQVVFVRVMVICVLDRTAKKVAIQCCRMYRMLWIDHPI